MGAIFKSDLNDNQRKLIISAINNGKKTIEVCQELGISVEVFGYCLIKYPLFAKEIQNARVNAAHMRVEELNTITDGLTTIADAAIARVKSDNIKWSAGKIVPHVYGDNINLNVSHSLDLSSILLAAENRVLPLLQAKSNIVDAVVVEKVSSESIVSVEIPKELEDLI